MSGVQVRHNLKARPDGKFDDRLATVIGERLIALEKAVRGLPPQFLAPEVPSFGAGNPGPAGPPGAPGAPGPSDHGALTGLLDDDHPQYRNKQESVAPLPHFHEPGDLVGLENQFLPRLVRPNPLPHVHTAEEMALDSRFYRRNERVPPTQHQHIVADVSDLRPEDMQFILAAKIFGG